MKPISDVRWLVCVVGIGCIHHPKCRNQRPNLNPPSSGKSLNEENLILKVELYSFFRGMPGGEKQYVVMEQQIEDLRERMRLLQQDRRANVDLLESNKSSNQEEIRYSREENKDLRVRLSQLQRAGDESQGENQELVHAQKEVLRMRAEYDSLKR